MEQSVKDIFRGRLKELIEGKKETEGKKKKDIAADLGIAYNTMNYYLSGERTPDIDILQKICVYFKVSPDYLLGYSEISTTDTKVRAIGEATGLSEINVERLMEQEKKRQAFWDGKTPTIDGFHDTENPKKFVNSCINFLYNGEKGTELDEEVLLPLDGFFTAVKAHIEPHKDWREFPEELQKALDTLADYGLFAQVELSNLIHATEELTKRLNAYLLVEVDSLKE